MWERGRSRAPNRGNSAGASTLHPSLPGRLPFCDWWRRGLAVARGPPLQERGRSPTRSRAVPPGSCARGGSPALGVTEARGPFGPRHRWSLWIVGRWPVLIPRFPGGAAPWEPPFVGVSAGSGPPTRGPYAAGHDSARSRAAWWNTLRADRCLRGYSGGTWMATSSRPAGAPAGVRGGRALVRPFQSIASYILAPPGVPGLWGAVHPGFPHGDPGAGCPGVVTMLSG